MIGIIDYGRGNLSSVKNAVEMITDDVRICSSADEFAGITKIVLPGVGAFRDATVQLSEQGWIPVLKDAVENKRMPLLGICLGMQILATLGYEPTKTQGLGWIRGEVRRIPASTRSLKIPHVGWNTIRYRKGFFLFQGLPQEPDLYFVHSYSMCCENPEDVVATVDYGEALTAVVHKGNVLGVQFHPEKSQDYGLKILENFVNWNGVDQC